jgi:hypothetical protein
MSNITLLDPELSQLEMDRETTGLTKRLRSVEDSVALTKLDVAKTNKVIIERERERERIESHCHKLIIAQVL